MIEKTDFKFPGQRGVYRGKVRDVYDLGEQLVIVTTDRYSAFDRNLALIPGKGELLTAICDWWFKKTSHLVPNHVIASPDPNVFIARKYKVIPIEMVVRGYITGVTNTSLWHTYSEGQRDYGEFSLPEGLKKNDKLPAPVLTPTTKFEEHDRNLTPQQAVKEGLLRQDTWQELKVIALDLFHAGQAEAESKGLILVDTKYEFGLDERGGIVLIDEIHTPDSSRYWDKDTYQESIISGEEPDNYDKEFLRLWFKGQFDPYKDGPAPTATDDIISEMSRRYAFVYERLSGNPFKADGSADPLKRIAKNVLAAL